MSCWGCATAPTEQARKNGVILRRIEDYMTEEQKHIVRRYNRRAYKSNNIRCNIMQELASAKNEAQIEAVRKKYLERGLFDEHHNVIHFIRAYEHAVAVQNASFDSLVNTVVDERLAALSEIKFEHIAIFRCHYHTTLFTDVVSAYIVQCEIGNPYNRKFIDQVDNIIKCAEIKKLAHTALEHEVFRKYDIQKVSYYDDPCFSAAELERYFAVIPYKQLFPSC